MNPQRLRQIERPLKALANRRRLAIVSFLKEKREASVGEIAAAINLSIKATSRHLERLAGAEVVEREQRSLHAFYQIASPLPDVAQKLISLL